MAEAHGRLYQTHLGTDSYAYIRYLSQTENEYAWSGWYRVGSFLITTQVDIEYGPRKEFFPQMTVPPAIEGDHKLLHLSHPNIVEKSQAEAGGYLTGVNLGDEFGIYNDFSESSGASTGQSYFDVTDNSEIVPL
jgi:hypothetical protein